MPISADSRYVLDGSYEMLSISPDVHAITFYRNVDVDGMSDSDMSLEDMYEHLNFLHDSWYAQSDTQRALSNIALLANSEIQLKTIISNVTNSVISAYLCHSQKNVDSLYEHINKISKFGEMEHQIKTPREMLTQKSVNAVLDFVHKEWIDDMHIRLDRAKTFLATTPTFPHLIETAHTVPDTLPLTSYVNVKYEQNNIVRAKKAIKRGIKTFQRMFGPEPLTAFLSGHDFIIEGKNLNYRVSKKREVSIIEHSIVGISAHIPYKLEIIDKDNIVMCEACVIFDKTPIIDQLVSLMMHVKSNEEEFLRTANFFNITDDFQKNETLSQYHLFPKPPRPATLFETEGRFDIEEITETSKKLKMISNTRDYHSEYKDKVKPVVEKVIAKRLGLTYPEYYSLKNPSFTFHQFLDHPQIFAERICIA